MVSYALDGKLLNHCKEIVMRLFHGHAASGTVALDGRAVLRHTQAKDAARRETARSNAQRVDATEAQAAQADGYQEAFDLLIKRWERLAAH